MCDTPPTAESMAKSVVGGWQHLPGEPSQYDTGELVALIEFKIAVARVRALATKETHILLLVHQWHRAFLCHDRPGEHNALRGIARECGGDISDFRGIPAH